MHKIEIVVQGHYYRDWPCLAVSINDKILYDKQIQDLATVCLNLENLLPNNTLTLTHYGKQFGDQGTYDTDPNLGLDRGITVKDIRFDGITIGTHKINQLWFETAWTPKQKQDLDSEFIKQRTCFECNGYLGFNGSTTIEFWTPILEWLTVFKYKVNRRSDLAYFSAFDQRWHYDEDLVLIKEIKELMKFE